MLLAIVLVITQEVCLSGVMCVREKNPIILWLAVNVLVSLCSCSITFKSTALVSPSATNMKQEDEVDLDALLYF